MCEGDVHGEQRVSPVAVLEGICHQFVHDETEGHHDVGVEGDVGGLQNQPLSGIRASALRQIGSKRAQIFAEVERAKFTGLVQALMDLAHGDHTPARFNELLAGVRVQRGAGL